MKSISKIIRQNILSVSHTSGHGHIPTCFSIVELLLAIYSSIRHDPTNPKWEERDFFILSKGHASLAHYAVLAEYDYFPVSSLDTFGALNSKFGCHADVGGQGELKGQASDDHGR